MKPTILHSYAANIDQTDTWLKFSKDMCAQCHATCCTMPTEVWLSDLIQMGVVDAFEAEEPPKQIAKRLMAARIVSQFNHARSAFTLARRANGDCLYLDAKTRLCTIYDKRPKTCRNHPQVGPKPGFCAYISKHAAAKRSMKDE